MHRYTDIETLRAHFPISIEPVNCKDIMKPEFVEYVKDESLSLRFPVLEVYANPRKSMQGGFICAAFDNTFGSLVLLMTGRMEFVNLDFNIHYHRPIFVNDFLRIKVNLQSQGKTLVYIIGAAYDGRDRLIASANTNIMLLDKDRFQKRT